MTATSSRRRRDPFLGVQDRPIECTWIGEPNGDEKLVRVLVDDDRWHDHRANADYQRSTVATIRKFVADRLPTTKLIVCPAGMFTFSVERAILRCDDAEIRAAIREKLEGIRWGCGPGVLLGVDAAVEGNDVTPLQSSLLIRPGARVPDWDSTIMKIYPAGKEATTLVGWRHAKSTNDLGGQSGRRQHSIGGLRVATLICHEAVAFGGRSTRTRSNEARMRVADHLARALEESDYVAVSTHWVDRTKGKVFLNAARCIADRYDAPVVFSTFAPKKDLELVADRLRVQGKDRSRVATLKVSSR